MGDFDCCAPDAPLERLFCGDEWDHEPHEWSSFGVYECAGYASHSSRD